MQEQENIQEQRKQTPEEKEKATTLKNEIITLRIILLCLAGIFSVYIPIYLGIHTEWVENIVGAIFFFSFSGLFSLIFIKLLEKYPNITSFVFFTLVFSFVVWGSSITPNKDAAFMLRIISLSILITIFGKYMQILAHLFSLLRKDFPS